MQEGDSTAKEGVPAANEGDSAARPNPLSSALRFFLLTFLITWSLQLPAVLARKGALSADPEPLMGLAALGVFGPLIAAALVGRSEGKGKVRELFSGLKKWRVPGAWFPFALFLPGALLVAGLALVQFFTAVESYFYLPQHAGVIFVALLISVGEEVGWRGFALPRLERALGTVRASLVIGAIWALWHIPMFVGMGMPLAIVPPMILFFVPGSVVFSWLYNRTGGSLVVMVLAHMGAHLNNSHAPLPGDRVPLYAHTLAFSLFALLLVWADKKAWKVRRYSAPTNSATNSLPGESANSSKVPS